MFFKEEPFNGIRLVDKLNLECNFENVRLFLIHFAGNTIVKIYDDTLEDYLYYKGSVSDYLECINNVNDYYVMNCSVKDDVLYLSVLKN